jgi:hypothetical protein
MNVVFVKLDTTIARLPRLTSGSPLLGFCRG